MSGHYCHMCDDDHHLTGRPQMAGRPRCSRLCYQSLFFRTWKTYPEFAVYNEEHREIVRVRREHNSGRIPGTFRQVLAPGWSARSLSPGVLLLRPFEKAFSFSGRLKAALFNVSLNTMKDICCLGPRAWGGG